MLIEKLESIKAVSIIFDFIFLVNIFVSVVKEIDCIRLSFFSS